MRNALLAVCCALLAACAPRFFVTQTATLDGESVKDASIRYEPMRDCWWKRMVPERYVIDRPEYRLELAMGAGHDDDSPSIDILVSGPTGPSLEFPGLAEPPEGQRTDSGSSYVLRTSTVEGDLNLRVTARGEYLGQEQFSVRYYRCHGLGFGGS